MVDVSALFGSSAASATPSIPALASFKLLQKNQNKDLEKFSRQQNIQKDLAYFKTKIAKITTPEQLVKDQRLLKITLSAFELDDELKFPAKIKEVLKSDPRDKNSFASRLIDPRFKKLAEAFGFAEFGTFHIKSSLFQNDVANRYVRSEFEKSLGEKNTALREAAYFVRNIGNVTDTFQILGDKVLRAIVTQTLGLPDAIAVQSVEKQKALIESRLDIKKFRPAGATEGAATKSTLDIANEEMTRLNATRGAAAAAQKAVQSITDRIQTLKDDYARLANIQDPAGPYAAEIPVQQAAAPELVRMRGLTAAAQEALGRVTSQLTRMSELVQLAGDPANAASLADYQTEFNDLRTEVSATVAGATYANDDATAGASFTAQSLLDGVLPSTMAVQIKSTGETASIRSFDLSATSSFQTLLDSANAAFQAVTGSGDSANISATVSALNSAKNTSNLVKQTVDVDANAFNQALATVPQWAATLETTELYPGAEAVRDAGSRLTEINVVLSKLRSLTVEASALADAADHTQINAKYDELVGELNDLISTPGAPVANLLAGGNQSYQVTTDVYIQARGRDLGASVGTVFSGGDLTSQANASALLAQIDTTVKDTMAVVSRELGIDSKFFSLAADTLDPRAKVDSQYRKLATDLPGLIVQAKSGDDNLLDPDQDAIKLVLASIGQTLTINPASQFDTNVKTVLDNASALLPTDSADSSGALAQLETLRFNVARVLSDLNTNVRSIDNARAMVGLRVKDLEGASTATAKPTTTAFAMQFIEKYLAKKDADNAAAGLIGAGGGGNAYLLSLIKPITIRGGGFDTSA